MDLLETLDTITKIYHVFGCEGEPPNYHVHSGLSLLKARNGYVCPDCGKPVKDITKTPTGNAYFQIGRPDLWRQP